jgi:hypothetical protein
MALNININVVRSLDQLSFTVIDQTGAYNVNSNPGGYGAPNPAVSDFTSCQVGVTMCDPVTLLPTGPQYFINAYPTLPNSSGNGFSIYNVSLGLAADQKIPDGVYRFSMEIEDINENLYSTIETEVFYEIVGCCIDTLTIEAAGCGCSSESKKIKDIVKANMWLGLLRPSVNELGLIVDSAIERCGQYEKAAEIIRELQKICNNQNCKGCNGC